MYFILFVAFIASNTGQPDVGSVPSCDETTCKATMASVNGDDGSNSLCFMDHCTIFCSENANCDALSAASPQGETLICVSLSDIDAALSGSICAPEPQSPSSTGNTGGDYGCMTPSDCETKAADATSEPMYATAVAAAKTISGEGAVCVRDPSTSSAECSISCNQGVTTCETAITAMEQYVLANSGETIPFDTMTCEQSTLQDGSTFAYCKPPEENSETTTDAPSDEECTTDADCPCDSVCQLIINSLPTGSTDGVVCLFGRCTLSCDDGAITCTTAFNALAAASQLSGDPLPFTSLECNQVKEGDASGTSCDPPVDTDTTDAPTNTGSSGGGDGCSTNADCAARATSTECSADPECNLYVIGVASISATTDEPLCLPNGECTVSCNDGQDTCTTALTALQTAVAQVPGAQMPFDSLTCVKGDFIAPDGTEIPYCDTGEDSSTDTPTTTGATDTTATATSTGSTATSSDDATTGNTGTDTTATGSTATSSDDATETTETTGSTGTDTTATGTTATSSDDATTAATTRDLGCNGPVWPRRTDIDCDDDAQTGCVLVVELAAEMCNINGFFSDKILRTLIKDTVFQIVKTLDTTTECPLDKIRAFGFELEAIRGQSDAGTRAAFKPNTADECEDLDELCGADGETPQFEVSVKVGLYCGDCDALVKLGLAFAELIRSGQIETDFNAKLLKLSEENDVECQQGFRDVFLMDDIVVKRYDANGVLLGEIEIEVPGSSASQICSYFAMMVGFVVVSFF